MQKLILAILNNDKELLQEAIEKDKIDMNRFFGLADLLNSMQIWQAEGKLKRFDIVHYRIRKAMRDDRVEDPKDPKTLALTPFILARIINIDTSNIIYLLDHGASLAPSKDIDLTADLLLESQIRRTEKFTFQDPHEPIDFSEPSENLSDLEESHSPNRNEPSPLMRALWRNGASLKDFRSMGVNIFGEMLLMKIIKHFTDEDSRRRIARDLNPKENNKSCEDLIFGLITKNTGLIDKAIECGADVVAVLKDTALGFILAQNIAGISSINVILSAASNIEISKTLAEKREEVGDEEIGDIDDQYNELADALGSDQTKIVNLIVAASKHHNISLEALSSCGDPKTFMGSILCQQHGLFKHALGVKSDGVRAVEAEIKRRKEEEKIAQGMAQLSLLKPPVKVDPKSSINSNDAGFDDNSSSKGFGL